MHDAQDVKEFRWNSACLKNLVENLQSWTRKATPNVKSLQTIDAGNISYPARANEPFDKFMKKTGEVRKKKSIDLSEIWLEYWQKIADNLNVSYVNTNTNKFEFRHVNIIPHVVPILAIVHTLPHDVVIIYCRWPNPQEDVPLRTVLLHSYSNIPKGNLQILHFLSQSLTELQNQLFNRGIIPIFRVEHFTCSPTLWLQYDIFAPLASASSLEKPKPKVSLQFATSQWVSRRWDNYAYLTYLNELSGRVRGEVHNHPIFPWVCDFSSKHSIFRPLNRTKYRLAKGDDQLREMESRTPSHHVPELLSDIGYMVYRARIESKENLCKHVRRKWVPEEYPSTMSRIYEWTPDECIPEFYDDPNVFRSRHADMSDLKVPEFCESPEDFIQWHRGMLENEEVSANLHRWIDLVFGYLLSPENSKNALNSHLCFAERQKKGVRTNGMVKLFEVAHPKRMPANYNPRDDCYRLELELYCMPTEPLESTNAENSDDDDDESIAKVLRNLKKRHRAENRQFFDSMVSVISTIAQITVAPVLHGEFDDTHRINERIRQFAHIIPINYQRLFDYLLDTSQEYPDPDEFSFFVRTLLNIPPQISDFHDEFANCMAFQFLRESCVVPENSHRSQLILLKEVESLKNAILICHHMEICVVAAFQKMLESEESSIQAVHRLMPAIARCLSESSLENLIVSLIELIQCETSVKLLDRRFLLYVSICYGAHKFLDLFLPPIVEACASKNDDRSIVAKESIMWLAKRYGPVICARFISPNLLRIMGTCFEGLELSGQCQEPSSVFNLYLAGDDNCARIETLLSEIVITYSVTFITVQFLPFCVDLIEQYQKRANSQLEGSLVSVFRIVELSIRSMTDHQLMNYLEEYIIQKIIGKVLEMLLNDQIQFSSPRARNIILSKAIQLLFSTAQRIGTENTRIYARHPFELLFRTFSEIYETTEELRIHLKCGELKNNTYPVPIWIAEDVVERFAKEWGVPFLSSFCNDPSFLIPFVSNGANPIAVGSTPTHISPTTTTLATFSLGNISTGNRIFSISSSSPANSLGNIGGLSSCEAGALSAVWCARVSAAVCNAKTLRFDHLSLCSFTGHSERIRKLAAISNENSFVSASSDKTVKLWSVKPERDEIECQWTYRNHTRSVNDVAILADNTIASVDGTLHVWDPFRSTILSQLEWDQEGGYICRIENVDRHTLAVVSGLHSSVKLFDTRVGSWTSELKLSPTPGLTRTLAVRDNGQKMAVAMTNGTLAILDARTGRINTLSHGNSTHVYAMNWIGDSQLLVCGLDEPGVVMDVRPRFHQRKKLADSVIGASFSMGMLATVQNNSMLRVYKENTELLIETRLRSDELPGTPSAVLRLPLNSCFLIGSNQGSIRLMC
ncbi:unnamed protein product [Caenorhabditis bovis]|uniref:BEACH domain-containing protein n=1 Tax=Caenorhabditis bovis TaxID=2654633 RepID=A0A8S1ETB6_9PELO|nr:unnamed protein product [Caenorhabditis bovis]